MSASFMSRSDRSNGTYKRTFNISFHARLRFRERVDDDYISRNDHDLDNLFDEKLRHPEGQWPIKDPRAPDVPTTLYGISTRKVGRFYVVVRNSTAITVLDERMAARNFEGQWSPPMQSPFATALAGVSPFEGIKLVPITTPPASPVVELLKTTGEPVLSDSQRAYVVAYKRLERAGDALEAAEQEYEAAEQAFDAASAAMATSLGVKP